MKTVICFLYIYISKYIVVGDLQVSFVVGSSALSQTAL